LKVCSTIAVDESARTRPIASDICQYASQSHRRGGEQGSRTGNLRTTEAKQPRSHLPDALRLQFQANEKEHHDDAELGEVLHRDDIDVQRGEQRTDRNSGDQIAEHRSEPEPGRNWDE
jgi:hypothetical protein